MGTKEGPFSATSTSDTVALVIPAATGSGGGGGGGGGGNGGSIKLTRNVTNRADAIGGVEGLAA